MVIAVDHGNSQIKTPHCVFPTAIRITKTPLPMATETVKYAESFYTLTNERIRYRRDKTTDGVFFALTLFAVAKELETTGEYIPGMEITLSVGLPPEHYARQEKRFSDYFKSHGREIRFSHNGKRYNILIVGVQVYPQAYAAICSTPSIIKTFPRAYIIDIGGYTVDVLLMSEGYPDLSMCRSLDMGIITMVNKAISSVNINFELPIQEEHVLEVLTGKKTVLSQKVRAEIEKVAQDHTDEIISQLRELGVDLRVDAAVLVGGGAQLFKIYIDQSKNTSHVEYIPDIKANARGFQVLAGLAVVSK